MTVRLAAIGVRGDTEPWTRLGFVVTDGYIAVTNGALAFGVDGLLLDGFDAHGESSADVDGITVAPGTVRPPTEHPNGAYELDHLVWFTSSLERSSAAIEVSLGLECRRVRETPDVRQAFHRFDDVGGVRGCILELAETDRVERSSLMGVVFNVRDLHDVADELGTDVMSPPKPAVQRGRWISTVRRDVGLDIAVAFMTPDRRRLG